jgi:hypothetical protein
MRSFPLLALAIRAIVAAPCVLAPPRFAEAQGPFAAFSLVWVRAQAQAGAGQGCDRMLVLNLPEAWSAGDAAVILFAEDDAALRAQHPLTDALLQEATAVLEFPSVPATGCTLHERDQVGEILGALQDLRVQAGAGLVVAIGVGQAGPAALAAAQEEVAGRYLGPAGPRLAAGIALQQGAPPAFAAGPPPPPTEGWHLRAPLLCDAVGAATGGPAVAQACRAALLPPLRLSRAAAP